MGDCSWSGAVVLSNRYHDPVNLVVKDEHCAGFYEKHPVVARCVFVSAAFIGGMLKPLTFVISSFVHSVVFPFIAMYKGYKGDNAGACTYIKAGVLNLLGGAVVASFFIISAYYLPLVASASIYMGATVFCIVVHVYRATEAPEVRECGEGQGPEGTHFYGGEVEAGSSGLFLDDDLHSHDAHEHSRGGAAAASTSVSVVSRAHGRSSAAREVSRPGLGGPGASVSQPPSESHQTADGHSHNPPPPPPASAAAHGAGGDDSADFE